jgi:hypothetical protein
MFQRLCLKKFLIFTIQPLLAVAMGYTDSRCDQYSGKNNCHIKLIECTTIQHENHDGQNQETRQY